MGTELATSLAGFLDGDEEGARHRAPPQSEIDTAGNTANVPLQHLAPFRQRKSLNVLVSITTPRVHHAARRRGGRVAARGAGAAGGEAPDHRGSKRANAFYYGPIGRRF